MGDYLKELREKVGHMPMVLPHSVVIVINNQNKILLEERADDGFYDFPGGGIDLKESAEEAAARELKEIDNFTMTFNKSIVRLESISLFSCYSNECANTFIVSGSNKEESWEHICTIAKTNETFKGKFTNVECKSNFAYKSIKLTQIAVNNKGTDYFTIYRVDLYGFLFGWVVFFKFKYK